MFVLSVKTTRKRLLILSLIVILIFVLLGVIISGFGTEADTLTVNGIEYSLKAHDNQERCAFLRQFGWDCSAEPVELVDVRIPSEFNGVYTEYNTLQKNQGFHLEKHSGTRVKRCTYEIYNYPGEPEGVRANLLILNGTVIGGDISSVALDGFMHGFAEGNPSLASDSGSISSGGGNERTAETVLDPAQTSAPSGGENPLPWENTAEGSTEDALLETKNLLELG